MVRTSFGITIVCLLTLPGFCSGQDKILKLTTPMTPPTWALLERQVLDASTDACREFYRRYFDERGWLLCVERWGATTVRTTPSRIDNDWPFSMPSVARTISARCTRRPGRPSPAIHTGEDQARPVRQDGCTTRNSR